MMIRIPQAAAAAALVATATLALLAACGGSSDDGAPLSRTTIAVGTITGFGSVIVNGVEYGDAGAVVTVDDQPASASALKVGMVVAVDGETSACPQADTGLCAGVAARIRFRNNVVGPVTQVNQLANTLQVMGRDVQVDDLTGWDGVAGDSLGGLAVGDMVAVSGLMERDRTQDQTRDRLHARLVQRTGTYAAGTSALLVNGIVSAIDTAAGTCLVDDVAVDIHALAAADLPAGGLAAGQYVAVQGKAFANGLVTADRIQLRDRISYPDASLVELEGAISGFVSVADFTLDGQQVDASAAVFRNGTAADLQDGAIVEVEGTMSGGVLLARKVVFRLQASLQLVAPLQSIDTAAGTFVLLGQTLRTTPSTQYVDESSVQGAPVRDLALAALSVGDRIDVRASRDAATGALVAARVVRTEPDPLLVARGPVDATRPVTGLTLLGVDVETALATRYRDLAGTLVTDAEFYALVQVPPATPSVVRAQGIASATNGSTIDATRASSTSGELEIER